MSRTLHRCHRWAREAFGVDRALAIAVIGSTSLMALVVTSGSLTSLDRRLSDAWFSTSKRGASDQVVIVDTVRAAVAHGDGLRLPRARLAGLIDELAAAGAGRILIDLTLSGSSTPADDDALENALVRLGPDKVALTAAAVATTDHSGATHWRRTEVLQRFGLHAARVASDFAFDSDGQLRRFGIGGIDLPPMMSGADWLAGRQLAMAAPRRIDFGIDVRHVPVIDALDLGADGTAQGQLKGRRIVLASYATALGQTIRVPRFGELQRPDITALSAETVLRDQLLHPADRLVLLWLDLFLVAAATLWFARLGPVLGMATVAGFSLLVLGISASQQTASGLMLPAAEPILGAMLALVTAQIARNPALRRVREALGGFAGRIDMRLARVLDETGEALVTFAPDGKILSMNVAARELFARSPEPNGISVADLIGARAGDLLAATVSSRAGHMEATIDHGGAQGQRHLDLRVNTMRAEAGEWIGIASIRDVTDQRAQVEALRRMATQDPLTGLLNRLGFEKALADGCAEPGSGRKPEGMAVLLCDLDGFKGVNDTLGHQAGDALLREIARRLQTSVQPGTVVARLGGDEFGLVLSGSRMDGADACAIAEGLVAAVAEPIIIEGSPVRVGVSIGVAVHPTSGRTPEDLVRVADAAMYRAKRARAGVELGLQEAA